MASLETIDHATRFYASTCPVCRGLALEAFVTARSVQIECGSCGGYGITAEARSMISKQSEGLRKEWLAQARHQASSNLQIALVDTANEPKL